MIPTDNDEDYHITIYECQLESFSADLVTFLTRHAKCVVCSTPIQISSDKTGFEKCACGKNIEDMYDAYYHIKHDHCPLRDFIIKVKFDMKFETEFQELWRVCNRRRIDRAKKQKRKDLLGTSGKILAKHQVNRLLEAQESKCYYCGKTLSNTYDLDHVLPVSDGGSNDISNIVIACSICNRKKGAKAKDPFIKMLQKQMPNNDRAALKAWRRAVDIRLNEVN